MKFSELPMYSWFEISGVQYIKIGPTMAKDKTGHYHTINKDEKVKPC